MKLLIAIPALNEDQSIASIIERCLAAVPRIVSETGVSEVDVTVVSDGSTDRTVEIASSYLDKIGLIVFDKNRGYGAAIKEAWRQSDAELLGFIDADGTCEPNFFTQLCPPVVSGRAEIVLGCRQNEASEMPRLRRVGNQLFAILLRALSSREVRDTASGMRVVHRDALPMLYPLPDGLHFTPAMSARALLSNDVRIVEIDMPYREREGHSKLRVGRDGIRFLEVILQTAVLYRPFRVLAFAAIPFLVAGLGLLTVPAFDWIRDGTAPIGARSTQAATGAVLLLAAALLFSAGYLAGRIVDVVLQIHVNGRAHDTIARLVGARWFWLIPALLVLAGASAAIIGSFSEGDGRGVFTMVVLGTTAVILAVTRLLDRFIEVVAERLRYEREAVLPVLAQR